jgi:hypothetical protein
MRLRLSERRSRRNQPFAAPAISVAAQVTGSPARAGPTAPWISQVSSGSTKALSGAHPTNALRSEPLQNDQFRLGAATLIDSPERRHIGGYARVVLGQNRAAD